MSTMQAPGLGAINGPRGNTAVSYPAPAPSTSSGSCGRFGTVGGAAPIGVEVSGDALHAMPPVDAATLTGDAIRRVLAGI
jgi:hypothetical protein